MKHEANFTAAPTQESSPFYDGIVLERGNYRIIRGRDSSRYPKQFIVQKFKGGRYRNLTYHMNWDSIGLRHGSWLVNPDEPKISL
jgi:hypothetical protein